MPTVGPFRMINHRFEVVCSDPATADLVARTLMSVRARGGEVHDRYVIDRTDWLGRYDVAINGRRLRTATDHHGVIDGVCTEANRLAIHSSTAPAVLHAGAVERDRQAVVIAGHSGAGKSTLVTRMLREGWRYLTDEGAQLTRDLTVLPYLKPIVGKFVTAQVEGADSDVPRQHLDPTTFGQVCPHPAPVAGLILLGVTPSTRARQLVDACQLAFPVGGGRGCLDVLADVVTQRPVICLPARPAAQLVTRALTGLFGLAVQPAGHPAGGPEA